MAPKPGEGAELFQSRARWVAALQEAKYRRLHAGTGKMITAVFRWTPNKEAAHVLVYSKTPKKG